MALIFHLLLGFCHNRQTIIDALNAVKCIQIHRSIIVTHSCLPVSFFMLCCPKGCHRRITERLQLWTQIINYHKISIIQPQSSSLTASYSGWLLHCRQRQVPFLMAWSWTDYCLLKQNTTINHFKNPFSETASLVWLTRKEATGKPCDHGNACCRASASPHCKTSCPNHVQQGASMPALSNCNHLS